MRVWHAPARWCSVHIWHSNRRCFLREPTRIAALYIFNSGEQRGTVNRGPTYNHIVGAIPRRRMPRRNRQEFEQVLTQMEHTNGRELNWLEKRLDQAAPQALVVPS